MFLNTVKQNKNKKKKLIWFFLRFHGDRPPTGVFSRLIVGGLDNTPTVAPVGLSYVIDPNIIARFFFEVRLTYLKPFWVILDYWFCCTSSCYYNRREKCAKFKCEPLYRNCRVSRYSTLSRRSGKCNLKILLSSSVRSCSKCQVYLLMRILSVSSSLIGYCRTAVLKLGQIRNRYIIQIISITIGIKSS